MNDKIYKMELFEVLKLDQCRLMRVPGGWVCTQMIQIASPMEGAKGVALTSIFIPYDEEYKKTDSDSSFDSIDPEDHDDGQYFRGVG